MSDKARSPIAEEWDHGVAESGVGAHAYDAWLMLMRLRKGGTVGRISLLGALGKPSRLFQPGADLPAQGRQLREAVRAAEIVRERRMVLESGIRLVTWHDDHYPALLREIADPPVVLSVQGSLPQCSPAVAIVGARRASRAGVALAARLAGELAEAGVWVVSGLATGIDTGAHRGALEAGGRTIAVLGSGLARLYPRSNTRLAEAIRNQGALISEYSLWTPPRPANFPERNRIISGLSLGVIVIEAAARSGSLITARLALEQGRDVYAVPGAVADPLSQGGHRLIQQGAKLIQRAEDVLSELGWSTSPSGSDGESSAGGVSGHGPKPGARSNALQRQVADLSSEKAESSGALRGPAAEQQAEPAPAPLDGPTAAVYELIGYSPTPIDDVLGHLSLPPGVVSRALLVLELSGRILAEPGGEYRRC